MTWQPTPKPAEVAESRLVQAILDGKFPINSTLPAERELAHLLGITRPTLREALQRLSRDGWLEIRHGKATRVRDYWQEGSLGVLGAIAKHQDNLPPDFITQLLEVRGLLAPTYTKLAIVRSHEKVIAVLNTVCDLPDTPQAFARGDYQLHRKLTIESGNPVYTLILNGFADLYQDMARIYFAKEIARSTSHQYYQALLRNAINQDSEGAEALTRSVMHESIRIWQAAVRLGAT